MLCIENIGAVMELPCQAISKGIQGIKTTKSAPYQYIKTRGICNHGKTEPHPENANGFPSERKRKRAYSKKMRLCHMNNMQEYMRKMLTKGYIAIVLKAIIQYGTENQYLSGVTTKFKLPKLPVRLLKVLSGQEQNRLVNHVTASLDLIGVSILICLYTGIRVGELCALLWSDIDFETVVLRITKTLQRIKNTDENATTKTKIVIDTPKSTKSVREIPIPLFLFHILKQYEGKYNPSAYVLTGSQKYMEPRTFDRKFKKVLLKAEMDAINCHALRHTFATRAIEKGFDIKSLSEILGHSSVRFTLERYVHSSPELKKSHMEKLALCS